MDKTFSPRMDIFPDEEAYNESRRAAVVGKYLPWIILALVILGAGVAVWATNRDIFQ